MAAAQSHSGLMATFTTSVVHMQWLGLITCVVHTWPKAVLAHFLVEPELHELKKQSNNMTTK